MHPRDLMIAADKGCQKHKNRHNWQNRQEHPLFHHSSFRAYARIDKYPTFYKLTKKTHRVNGLSKKNHGSIIGVASLNRALPPDPFPRISPIHPKNGGVPKFHAQKYVDERAKE
jgi:hypothetical protein